MRLVSPWFNSNRNITVDRFYTSLNLAIELFKKKLTMVGTCMLNRKGIPEEAKSIYIDPAKAKDIESSNASRVQKSKLKKENTRQLFDSKFFASKIGNARIIIQSYVNKLKNVLLFISTMHNTVSIPFSISKNNIHVQNKKFKSDVNLFYNQTKHAVDTMDMISRTFTVKRGTNRWPLSVFFTLVDMIGINVFTCCKFRNIGKSVSHRDDFLFHLGCELVAPYLSKNRFRPGVQDFIVKAMNLVLIADNKVRKEEEK